MSRIGGAIRDTMSIENDASRVSVRERGRPVSGVVKCPGSEPRAFLFALVAAQMPSTVRTARAPTDLKPNLIRVKKRDDERARIGRWRLAALSKKTGQTPVRSLPRKENGKARTWMDEKSVRKSHGHHIPPAKGMGE